MIVSFSITSCVWALVVGATLCYAIYLDHRDTKEARESHKKEGAK